MSDASEQIECATHGTTPCTFACQHLTFGVACGYHAGADDPSDKWPDAWCDLCADTLRAAGGEWNEKAEKVAGIELMCSGCYEAARARNEHPPRHARGARTRLTKKETAALLLHATHEMQAAQAASDQRWRWNAMATWRFDDAASTLTFSDPASEAVIADVRLAGSYSTRTKTFQWAWETFDDGAPQARDVSRLRVFGDVRGIAKLTTPNWKCDDEVDGWEMASLAGYLLGAEALYRAPMQHVQWFMLLSKLRHAS